MRTRVRVVVAVLAAVLAAGLLVSGCSAPDEPTGTLTNASDTALGVDDLVLQPGETVELVRPGPVDLRSGGRTVAVIREGIAPYDAWTWDGSGFTKVEHRVDVRLRNASRAGLGLLVLLGLALLLPGPVRQAARRAARSARGGPA